MKDNKFLDWLFGFSIFGIGFVTSKTISFHHFKIDSDINLLDLASIFITIMLAYLVYAILDKNKEDRVKEKELILKRVDDIYTYIELNQYKIVNGSVKYSDYASFIKRCNNQVSNIEDFIKLTKIQLNIQCKDEIFANTRDLKNLMTNTLTNEEIIKLNLETNPIIVEAGNVTYSDERLEQIELKFEELKNTIIKYQLIINRGIN